MPIESFIEFVFVEAPQRLAAGDVSPAAAMVMGLAAALLVLRIVVSLRGEACTIDKELTADRWAPRKPAQNSVKPY